jgi:hypothetical protein
MGTIGQALKGGNKQGGGNGGSGAPVQYERAVMENVCYE